jgi:peptide chain release factor 1
LIDERDGFCALIIKGDNAAELFSSEPGGHRWQRVPDNDRHGRTHTSTVTVAVLPIPEKIEQHINVADIDFREVNLGGNGGQNRNRHYTDIIAKHRPTGIEVTARGRSQFANKTRAIQELAAKVMQMEKLAHATKTNDSRRCQLGSGMRGDKVRTINVKEGIVKCEITGQKKPFGKYFKGEISF